jgi:hypothetical protein
MPVCGTCHGARKVNTWGQVFETCPTCHGSGRADDTGSSGSGETTSSGGCLKYVAGAVLVVYAIFYFSSNPGAIHHPWTFVDDTVQAVRGWLSLMIERLHDL